MNYTDIDSYDCPSCSWSLHVEKAVWNKFPHYQILQYIQSKVKAHAKNNHDNKMLASKDNIAKYISSPYLEWPGKSGEEKE
jgi:hypothetical protein